MSSKYPSQYDTEYAGGTYHGQPRVVLRAATRRIRVVDLPTDVLFLIMDALLPTWALEDTPDGPTWTVSDLTDPLDITVATGSFHALTLASRRTCDAATPYLYRILHMRDFATVLSVWSTLSRHRPSVAPHVRHLLFGLALCDWTAIYRVAGVVLPLCESSAPAAASWDGHGRRRERVRWADGEVVASRHLYSDMPPITHKIIFDIVRRCANVQCLAVMPPGLEDVGATVLFRQALAAVAGPRLFLSPSVNAILERLRVVTLQVETSCREHLSAYGGLILPPLRRLTLISEAECWFLRLHDGPGHEQSAVLRKTRSLTVFWGRRSPLLNSDLRLELQGLPHLENLSIYLHPGLLAEDEGRPWGAPRAPADLNPQLSHHARNLKTLDLAWRLDLESPAWSHLGPPRRLLCLPQVHGLVKLQVSTQLLFGSLARLQRRLRAPAAEAEQTEDEYLARLMDHLLPASLQLLTLVEHWSAAERGRADPLGVIIELDAAHEQGDWMEVRWRDEARASASTAAAATAAAAADMINTPSDLAMLALMRVLCRVWLGRRREGRAVELRPQNAYFYGAYVHRVLMATEGLEGLRARRGTGPTGDEFGYSFVEAVFLRGVKVVVDQKRA